MSTRPISRGSPPGQTVAFTVDAHGARQFTGRVSQVRLQPLVAQNVVSYTTMIDVENPDLALKPGMTATVRIETARSDDTLRVPAAAVRFRPTADLLQAMGGAARATAQASARSRLNRADAPATGGAIWTLADGRLSRVPVEVGVSDGGLVAVNAPALAEGATVVTGVAAATRFERVEHRRPRARRWCPRRRARNRR